MATVTGIEIVIALVIGIVSPIMAVRLRVRECSNPKISIMAIGTVTGIVLVLAIAIVIAIGILIGLQIAVGIGIVTGLGKVIGFGLATTIRIMRVIGIEIVIAIVVAITKRISLSALRVKREMRTTILYGTTATSTWA